MAATHRVALHLAILALPPPRRPVAVALAIAAALAVTIERARRRDPAQRRARDPVHCSCPQDSGSSRHGRIISSTPLAVARSARRRVAAPGRGDRPSPTTLGSVGGLWHLPLSYSSFLGRICRSSAANVLLVLMADGLALVVLAVAAQRRPRRAGYRRVRSARLDPRSS